MKVKKQLKSEELISLIDYYHKNKTNYLKLSVELTLETLLHDLARDYPATLKPVRNTIIAVESIDKALSNVNFNWVNDLYEYEKLIWFKNEEPIGSLADFYRINKKQFDHKYENKKERIENILKLWKHYIEVLMQNTGSFHNKIFGNVLYTIFIKVQDMSEWSKEPENFECKSFGDRESLVSINFYYKDNDKDFEASNLEASILKAKKLSLLK